MTNHEHVSDQATIIGDHIDISLPNPDMLRQYLDKSPSHATLYRCEDDTLRYPIKHAELSHDKDAGGSMKLDATFDFGAGVVNSFELSEPWQATLSTRIATILNQNEVPVYRLSHQLSDFYVRINDMYAAHLQFQATTHECYVDISTIRLTELFNASNGEIELEPDPDDCQEPDPIDMLQQFSEIWSLAIDSTVIEFGEEGLDATPKPTVVITAPTDTMSRELVIPSIEEPPLHETLRTEAGFNLVGGLSRAKARLQEIAAVFSDPIGAKMYGVAPRHFLIHGPPGTGKTTLVNAFANEVNGELMEISSSSIIDKWVGDSAKNLDNAIIDAQTKASKGRVVVFFDEFDLIAKRGNAGTSERSDVRKRLGVILESISATHSNIIIAAATNADMDDLEPSLIRSGRFELIGAPLPTEEERIDVWAAVLTQSMLSFGLLSDAESTDSSSVKHSFIPYEQDLNVQELARRTEGMSGADFKVILERARYKHFMRYTQNRLTDDNTDMESLYGRVSQADIISEINQFGR